MELPVKGRELILSVVIVFLLIACGYFLTRNLHLEKSIQAIHAESKKTKTLIEDLERENQSGKSMVDQLVRDKNDLENSLGSLKKQYEEVSSGLKKVQRELSGIKEEKVYLEEMLINKTRELESKNKQIDSVKGRALTGSAEVKLDEPPAGATTQELIAQIRFKNQQLAGLTDKNQILAEKLDKLYQTTSDRMEQIKTAKAALEEAVEVGKRKIDDEWKTVNLGSIKVASDGSMPVEPPVSSGFRRPAKVQGKILVINKQHGFVVVSLGRADGVIAGTEFAVSRQWAQVGILTTMEIQEMMTACRIRELNSGQSLEIDDDVAFLQPGPPKT
ncbi:MAG: hypothetical protein WCG06_01720 [Candidatus Omnitrophota bacterium]